jgi:carboxyl-terminal processing protease
MQRNPRRYNQIATVVQANRQRRTSSMSTKAKAIVLSFSVLIIGFVGIGGLGVGASTRDGGAYKQLGVYSEVLSRIRSEYVEDPNVSLVTDGALHGLLESLDANSSYLSPVEYKSYKERKNDGKANIGASLSKRFGYAAVVAVIPGGPGDKAGIESGDIIEAVEGRSTRDMSLAEIQNLMKGQPGSNINLSIVRARRAEPQKITVTRDVVTAPPVTDRMMESGIAYIKADTLTKGKAQEVANKIKELQRQGAKRLLLDLRNCAGGDESEGIGVANLFLNRGLITYLQGQKYPRETFNADPQKAITNLPLVVLVNRGTAGPAEIVAASILENARGDVLGDKTFGVGSIQKVIEVPDGSALILSVAKYYSPNGKSIQDNAVTPNIVVAAEEDTVLPDDDESLQPARDGKQNREDEQLKRGVEVLKNRAE